MCWSEFSTNAPRTCMVCSNSWENFTCSWSRQVSPRLSICPCSAAMRSRSSLLNCFRLRAKRRNSLGSMMACGMRLLPRGHDKLPLCRVAKAHSRRKLDGHASTRLACRDLLSWASRSARSEEHTSELQSRQYLVCRLLLEKKNVAIHQQAYDAQVW